MPPLIAAVLIGAGAYAGLRAAYHLWDRATRDQTGTTDGLAQGSQPAETISEKDLGALEYDPASGIYRPSRRS